MVHYKRHFHAMLAMLALLLLAAGCGRMQAGRQTENPNFIMNLAVQPSPATVGAAQLLINLTDPAGKAVEGARIHVEGNMAHAGMMPVFADAGGGQGGHYVVPINLTMDGDWMLDVTATMADGQTTSHRFPLRVGG